MRLGINLTHLVPGKIGGMENYLRALIEFLPKINADHEYLAILPEQYEKNIFTGNNIKRISIPPKENLLQLSKALLDVIETEKIDCWLSPLLILDPLGADIVTAFSIPDMQHEYYPRFFNKNELAWRKRYFDLSAFSSDLIFTISNDSKKDIVKFLNVPAEKVSVTYLDCDPVFKKPLSSEKKKEIHEKYKLPKKYLFFPANTWPHKNHKKLIQAFEILAKEFPDLNLLFTGFASNGHPELLKTIEQSPNKEKIRFLGYLDKDDLPYLYNNAELLTFPSLFEGFGIPVLEAMNSFCPVACSNKTSLPEIAGDGAIYFDPDDPKDMAAKIKKILKTPSLKEKLIQKGKKLATKFSYLKMAEITLKELEKIYAKKKKNKPASDKPKISIITPSYNQGEFLEACIKSVIEQNDPNLEYIIMDGGSKDNSVEIIKKYAQKYPEVIKWRSQKDKGQSDAINKGLEIARGEIVAWINSDDTYEANCFNKIREFFEENPEAAFVHGIGYHVNKTGDFIEVYPSNETSYEKLHSTCQICQPTTFWKRNLCFKAGYLNPDLNFAMDYEYWIRLSKITKLNFLEEHLANTRLYDNTKTVGQAEKVHKEIMEMTKKHYATVSASWIFAYAHAKYAKTRSKNKYCEFIFRLKLIVSSLLNFYKYNKKIASPERKQLWRWLKDSIIILLK